MRIILDTSTILGEEQSSFRYFSELIPRLKCESGLTLDLLPSPYFDLPREWSQSNLSPQLLLPKASWLPQGKIRKALSRIKWTIEEKRQEQLYFRSGKELPLFHSFLSTVPPSTEAIVIHMAHDTIIEKLGNEIGMREQQDRKLQLQKKAFERAQRIIAVSDQTRKDLAEVYDIPYSKVDRIYHAVNTDFFGAPIASDDSQALKVKFSISRPYLLQVGGRLHHRNFSRLAEAFALSGLHRDYFLVCAGEDWMEEEKNLLKRLGILNSVRLAKKPNIQQLRGLYQGAQMLVYPSLYEGFGLPLVEAMAAGTPVATSSKGGSIPEVAGDAALYFDPRDPQDMVRAISHLIHPEVADEYRKKGKENVKRFSWDLTAQETIQCYRKAMGTA